MNIQKVFKSGHPYLCEESVEAFFSLPGSENFRTFKDLCNVIENDSTKAHMRLALANSNQKDNVKKWIRRTYNMNKIFDVAILGGDLEPTGEWRVSQGIPIFYGTKKECVNYLRGSHLKFKKDGEIVLISDDWDECIDPEGRSAKSLEHMYNDVILERRYYDEVDDYEIWHFE